MPLKIFIVYLPTECMRLIADPKELSQMVKITMKVTEKSMRNNISLNLKHLTFPTFFSKVLIGGGGSSEIFETWQLC